MAQLNPMLEKLQRQIQDYNKDVEAIIDKVANHQNLITLSFVVFNVIVFLVLESLLGKKDPIFSDIPNTVISFVATLILLLVSFPLASKYAKRNFQTLQLNEEQIEPKLNYAGEWSYKTNFRIQSREEDCEEYRRLKDNMEGYKEEGTSIWTQNVFDLKIGFANTIVSTDRTKDGVKPPQVTWHSDPASYDESEIHWSFNGKIWWGDDKVYCNEFCGIEYYNVKDHDVQGRPSLLEGHLVGTVLVGKKLFAVDATSKFERKNI